MVAPERLGYVGIEGEVDSQNKPKSL